MYNPVESYLRNHIEALSGDTCIMYGVDANDILKVVREEPSIHAWEMTYYLEVSKATNAVRKLVRNIFN